MPSHNSIAAAILKWFIHSGWNHQWGRTRRGHPQVTTKQTLNTRLENS